ncbi:DUF4012 domain-containing protein, partial [Candidatus Gottesmanbacteria bacterium]|nr:DUF4012 domain-containing protein [Candidatus Gottesmanbacteria bacterium]
NLVKIKNIFGVAPWILGLKGKRTYLVLFQNNFELRPGGGFIGSLGFLTFNSGKLDLKIEDVYTADGQLRGHVEPPKPIRQYLNQIHWYLRDSNWEPDFPSNAQKAAWFLEKELGIKPDGVIGLDLSLVKKVLAITGPVDLPDYQEKISADNLFLKAQIYSQESFFPGSTQKRDFLGALANALFNKLATDKSFPWLGIAKAVEEATQEKHLAVFFDEPLPQKLMSEQGWGGEIKMENGKKIEDYLMIVDANLGVNKVNYFVKREIKKEMEAKDNFLFTKTILNYENTSPANVSFGGVYKNYLRVLIATGATLEKIIIDGEQLDLRMIDQETIFGKISTGFLVEVPPGDKKTIELFYKTPIDTSSGEFTYQLLVQKQTGTEKDPFSIASNFGLSYNGDLSTDRVFVIKFKK